MDLDINTQALLEWGLRILYAAVIYFIGTVVAGWSYKAMVSLVRRRSYDELIGRFLASLVKYTVLIFAGLAALEKLGVNTTSLVAIFASAGLAVGLALQGNLSNFSSGVLLLIFRPFEVGDVVSAAGETGQIVDIGLFTTVLHTPDNQKLIVPNSAVTGGNIINLTTLGTRGGGVSIGVAYGTDLDEAARVLVEAARGVPEVMDEPAPSAFVTSFGASSVDFVVKYVTSSKDFTAGGGDAVPSRVRVAIYKALDEAGIEIPFDQVVVHRAPVEDDAS